MLKADEMLKDLSGNVAVSNYKDSNDDKDFGEILKFWGGEPTKHKLRCSDGTERTFSFDE